jgi:hypothetical protein
MRTDAGHDVLGVLDEGVVISGDVQVRLFGMKVLPVRVNLLISSVERAESLGLSWWGPKGKKGAPSGGGRPAVRKVGQGAARNGASNPRNGRGKHTDA